MTFDTLGLSNKVVDAVGLAGYTTPTPIQEQAIPHVLARRDLVGIAQTGTGKTASFVLPMLTALERGRARARMPRTLILEPTRELAAQVEENFEKYGIHHKLTVALLIGGVSFEEQDKKITRGADVLIATPGRLLDHFERGRLLLTGVEILVIDEADRMLDMGFIPDIERIVKLIPFTRQTLLFSATMPPEIGRLADQFLQNPVRVEVAKPASTADNVSQAIMRSGAKPAEKRASLRQLIDTAEGLTNAIIFCNRKRDVATVQRSLERHGYSVGALHGDMDQHHRLKTLDSFRDNKITLLVASDVAARGLDIPAVSHIFNFDVPTHAEDYVHRIGRTGRAGRSGAAVSIATSADKKYIAAIENLIGQTIEVMAAGKTPDTADADAEDAPKRRKRPTKRSARASTKASKGASDKAADGNADATAGASADDGSEEATKKTSDSRRSRRRRSGRAAEAESAAGVDSPAHADAAQEAGETADAPGAGADERKRRGGKSDSDKVGFCDHVPAFMLRPTRVPAKEEEAVS